MTELIKNSGLKPTPPDKRDAPFAFGAVVKQIDINEVPNDNWDFSELTIIEDQKHSDWCGGYSGSEVTEDQEGEEMCPAFQFAASKHEEGGDPDSFGTNLRAIGQGHRKIGSLPVSECPHCKSGDYFGSQWRRLDSWPQKSLELAKRYRKKAMVWVDKGRYDTFDNIRSALYQYRDEKRSVVTGVVWQSNWTDAPGGIIPDEPGEPVGGHAVKKVIRQQIINGEEHLVMQNSYGEGIGDGGLFYFPRKVVNKYFTFGALAFVDQEPEEIRARFIIKQGIKNMNQSDIFKLNWRDITNGLVVSVISAVLVAVQQMFSENGLSLTADDAKTIFTVAITAGIGYLVKNLFQDKQGNNPVTDAVGKALNKK